MEPFFKVGDEVRFKMPKHIPMTVSGEWIPGIGVSIISSLEIIASSDRIKGKVTDVRPDEYDPKLFPTADSLDGALYKITITCNHPAGNDLVFRIPCCCLERVTNDLTPNSFTQIEEAALEDFQKTRAAIASKTAHLEEVLSCPCVTAPVDFKSPVVELTLPDPDKPYKFNFKN